MDKRNKTALAYLLVGVAAAGRALLAVPENAAIQEVSLTVLALVGYLLLAFIGGLFIEKSKGQPVISGVGLVLGDAACYVLGTAWFVFQMQCELGYALSVCVYPFIALDLAKIVETVVLVRIVVIADLAGSTETKIRSYTLYIIPGRLNTIRDFFIKSSTTPTTIAISNWS